MKIVILEKPVDLKDGRTVEALHIQIPAEATWDANPPGVLQSHWNLAQFAGIDVVDVPLLSDRDIDGIGEAAKGLMRLSNRNVIDALPLSRAERRRTRRASNRLVNSRFHEA